MITITCNDTLFTYNLYHICKAFFPNEEIVQHLDVEQEPFVKVEFSEGSCFSVAGTDEWEGLDRSACKMRVTKIAYDNLSEMTGKTLAWGMLTGVRPTKLAMQKIEEGMGIEESEKFLEAEYGVSEEKAKLAVDIALREKKLLSCLDYEDGFSLYVGIPFCPSICSYCSFSSSPIDRWKGKIEEYLETLCKEVRAVAEITKGKKLNTIYIGGGTPTTLEADQLEKLLKTIDENFSYEHLQEYTVEAGRPDSITTEKLQVLREHPITRISVNPQTMQQKTLDVVGRKHTVQDVKDIFNMARELGFDNINMDLIAGLPGETAADMQDTLRQIEELAPDSLTVHSLAIKRAARMNREDASVNLGEEISQMVKDSAESAKRMNLYPYYLYRQKNIAGNFENVGYAKKDKAGIYNILIMEEKQTIVACGAGASTKRVYPDGRIERCENVKDVLSYITRIDEMIERKRSFFAE